MHRGLQRRSTRWSPLRPHDAVRSTRPSGRTVIRFGTLPEAEIRSAGQRRTVARLLGVRAVAVTLRVLRLAAAALLRLGGFDGRSVRAVAITLRILRFATATFLLFHMLRTSVGRLGDATPNRPQPSLSTLLGAPHSPGGKSFKSVWVSRKIVRRAARSLVPM